jgi:hypothetical protein
LAIKYLPFNFFDDTAIQNFFVAINSNLNYPKCDIMKRRVLEIFEKKDAVINILKNNEYKISFTVDAWTSIAGKSYYGITAHFVDANWKLQSIVLDFVPSNGAHTGKDIATLFYNSLKNFNIMSKIQGNNTYSCKHEIRALGFVTIERFSILHASMRFLLSRNKVLFTDNQKIF